MFHLGTSRQFFWYVYKTLKKFSNQILIQLLPLQTISSVNAIVGAICFCVILVRCILYVHCIEFVLDCENELNFYEETKFQLDGTYLNDYLMHGAKPSYKVSKNYYIGYLFQYNIPI